MLKPITIIFGFVISSFGQASITEQPRAGGVHTGALKGTALYNEAITEGAFTNPFYFTDAIELSRFEGFALAPLFGFLPIEGGRERQGDAPSPVNMFLWDAISRSLGNNLGTICESEDPIIYFGAFSNRLNSDAFEALATLCSNTDPQSLTLLWELFIGFEAPQEMEAWISDIMNLLDQDKLTPRTESGPPSTRFYLTPGSFYTTEWRITHESQTLYWTNRIMYRWPKLFQTDTPSQPFGNPTLLYFGLSQWRIRSCLSI